VPRLKSTSYFPLACLSVRSQITWWDAYDCQAIRILDGSLTSEVYSIDISPDGLGLVSGGVDREVKLWNYDEGHNYFVGLGHSESITKVLASRNELFVPYFTARIYFS
jgi:WD40 repeat protein